MKCSRAIRRTPASTAQAIVAKVLMDRPRRRAVEPAECAGARRSGDRARAREVAGRSIFDRARARRGAPGSLDDAHDERETNRDDDTFATARPAAPRRVCVRARRDLWHRAALVATALDDPGGAGSVYRHPAIRRSRRRCGDVGRDAVARWALRHFHRSGKDRTVPTLCARARSTRRARDPRNGARD